MFHRVGLAVLRENKVLMVRNRGSRFWAIPGGRIEEGETPEAALARELGEELRVSLKRQPQLLGTFHDRAAVTGEQFSLSLFAGDVAGKPVPSNEIAECTWFDGVDKAVLLPPMFVNHVQPALQNVLGWTPGA